MTVNRDILDQLFLTVTEVADLLRTDPRTVRRAIEAGDIPAIRVSGVLRIPTARFLTGCGLTLDELEDDEADEADVDGELDQVAATSSAPPLSVVPDDADPQRAPPAA